MDCRRILQFLVLGLVAPALQAGQADLSAEALRARGVQYENGEGVNQDYFKAYRLYCIAAVRGNREAQYNLGWMYFNGRGVNRDDARAAGWLERAAAEGDDHATKLLTQLSGTNAESDPDCPLPRHGGKPSRIQIEAWVRIIAPEFGVDPDLVLAVIAAESGFNARAWSPKDARGVMQLLPATAKRFGVEDAWHPVANITGGVAYLNWLLRFFDGDVQLALAAYNAGERVVQRYGGVPPYRETRRYVRRILDAYSKPLHPIPPRPQLN